jgi:hypothetical protein
MMEKSAQPGEGVHAHPLSLCLPSRTKLWCTLQREGRFALNEAEGYRGLGQHGGPPGWLEESDPAGVILYVVDGAYHLPFPYRTGALELPKLRADGQTHKEGMACYSSRPMPSLWIYTLPLFLLYPIRTLWCKLSLHLSVSVLVFCRLSFCKSQRVRFFLQLCPDWSVRTLTAFRHLMTICSQIINCTLIFPVHNKIGAKSVIKNLLVNIQCSWKYCVNRTNMLGTEIQTFLKGFCILALKWIMQQSCISDF